MSHFGVRRLAAAFRSSCQSNPEPLQQESPSSPVFSHPEIHQIRMSAKKLFSAKSPRPLRLCVIFSLSPPTTLVPRCAGTKSHPPLAQRTLSPLAAPEPSLSPPPNSPPPANHSTAPLPLV